MRRYSVLLFNRYCLALVVLLPPLFTLSSCSSRVTPPPAQIGAPVAPGDNSFFTIDLTKYPGAVCNDGSPGAFIYRRGQDEGANKWVLILKGGGACSTVEACSERALELKSSTPWKTESLDEIWGLFDGIVNTDSEKNAHFYNWNHVVFIYCSSDSWLGQHNASSESGDMPFRGHFIIEAIIDALRDEDLIGNPTLSTAEDIIFAGSSAGAGGVRNNIDWVSEILLSYQIDADFRGVLDAGVGPISSANESFETPGNGWVTWQSFTDQDCADAHAESGNPWICTSAEYLLTNNFISTPLFVYHDQNDRVTSNNYSGDDFQDRILNIIAILPNAFSPNERIHYLITKDLFYAQILEYPAEFVAGYELALRLVEGESYSYSDLLWLWYSREIE